MLTASLSEQQKYQSFLSGHFQTKTPLSLRKKSTVLAQDTIVIGFQTVLRNILKELGYTDKVINSKVIGISDERRLCEILVFDIIPYSFDIRSINPLNYSQTLQKYIKKSCYAKLLERWLDA